MDRAYRSVKRACYSGLDSLTLRQEVARRAAPALASDAYALSTADPLTGLLTNDVAEGVSFGHRSAFLWHVYPHVEAELILNLGRSGRVLAVLDLRAPGRLSSLFHSDEFADLLRAHHFGVELRAALTAGPTMWGAWCVMRDQRTQSFTEGELAFVRRIAPHLARGLRAANWIDAAMRGGAATQPGSDCVGVLVLDDRWGVTTCTPSARAHLADLEDLTDRPNPLPLAVCSLVGRLQEIHRASHWAEDTRPESASLTVRGRSGSWYVLEASLSEPDATGSSSIAVVISPARRTEVAPILGRLYGLSPREREVLTLVARGDSTREIAARLGISPYTVQDHLDHAFDKVGVRGRRALLAKLFFDVIAARPA
jgi:DNA-binding CsgD family transcriptional regulator